MATKIILLDVSGSDGGLVNIRVVFWIPAQTGQEVGLPNLPASAWKDASPEDLAALRVGTVIEESRAFTFGQSLDEATIEKMIQIAYSDRAAFLASLPPRGKFYGKIFDGSWK